MRERIGGVPFETKKSGGNVEIRFYPKGENAKKSRRNCVHVVTFKRRQKETGTSDIINRIFLPLRLS